MLASTSKHARNPERRLDYGSFRVRSLTPSLGAEVEGLDLSQPLEDAQFALLRQAFSDWMVLVFRDQQLSQEQHKDFGRRFGRLHSHPMHKGGYRGADPEILPVVTESDSAYTAGDGWHTDVTCDEVPPFASLLYMHETPECGGGDTLFANMALAYETLSDPVKEFLGGLRAMHDGSIPYVGGYGSKPPEGGYPRNEHPVVTRHPETGARILYVNSGFTSHIIGLSREESRSILGMLYRHVAETPRLHCRVQWQPNTLTLWDNRCTQHHAIWDYHPHSRRGERVSVIDGKRPAA